MAPNQNIVRYRSMYRKLLRLYPKHYRERYGEAMEQTFTDVCRHNHAAGKSVFATVLWIFIETSSRIIRENTVIIMAHDLGRRLIIWGLVVGAILMIPLVAMQFTTDVDWSVGDFIAMGILLYGSAFMYELIAMQGGGIEYRVAVALAVLTGFLLVWVNLAVGIIGSEDHPANTLYIGVIIIGLIGTVIARLKPRGMSYVAFVVSAAQFLVPFIALAIWAPTVMSTDEGPGVAGVIMLNSFFAALFAMSAILFRQSSNKSKPEYTTPAH